MLSRLNKVISRAKLFLIIPRDNPELVQAELAAFSKQVPLMYALVMINMMALAVTHYHLAPPVLTVYIPAALDMVCCIRMLVWWRSRGQVLSHDQAIKRLRGTILFAGLLGTGFSAWSLSLFPYGNAYTQGHVAFFMAVTVIGCGFCLMHLRTAAVLVMALVVIPFSVYLGSSGNPVYIAMSANFAMVVIAVTFMLLVNYRGFENLINSQKALRAQQADLQILNDINFQNSHIDSLTGLPNRRHFFTELKKRLLAANAANRKIAVGILDLDGFKPINDIYGHATGDRLLGEIGKRLRACLSPSIFFARLGGDEFVLIIETGDVADSDIGTIGASLTESLGVPFALQDLTVRIGCSMGFAKFPSAASTAEDLFERADYALYYAKQHHRGNVVIFSAEHEASIREASTVTQALVNADLERELWIAYQPIVDAETRQPVGFEALARWRSPKLGDVPPTSFILAAERSGLITQLTPILLRKALEGAANWPDSIRISFNLSAVDVASTLSILKIISIVEQSGVKPGRIDFEITETAVMRNFTQASEALDALRRQGARIALDDFGTGYSSLSCIRELPLDKIKIDRSFIVNIESDAASQLILRTMVGLCKNLQLDCIVEGVETAEQMQFLRGEDCRLMQGYFFARPMNGDQAMDYVALCGIGGGKMAAG